MNKQVARDISYSFSAQTKGGKAVIRTLENVTGRLKLIKRAEGYQDEVAQGADFWQVMVARYGLSLNVVRGALSNIPNEGPLVVVSNHPYGILDGLMLGHVMSQTREDFKIMAHAVFNRAPDLNRHLLPISFDADKSALAMNLATRRHALDYLGKGGAVGVFPGGTVSTGATPFSRPMDPGWRSFTARMIAKSRATVVPIYFDGHTSRLFQLASHLHSTLRLGLLIKEFRQRVDTPVQIVVGAPIPAHEIAARKKDARELMDFLRKATYELSPRPVDASRLGHEFEDRYKARHGGGHIR